MHNGIEFTQPPYITTRALAHMKTTGLVLSLTFHYARGHGNRECAVHGEACHATDDFCDSYRLLQGGWCASFGMQDITNKAACAHAIQSLGHEVHSHVYEPHKSAWPGCQFEVAKHKIWQQGPNNPAAPGGMQNPNDGFIVVCKYSGLTEYTSVASGLCTDRGFRQIRDAAECETAAASLNIHRAAASAAQTQYTGCSYTNAKLFINAQPESSHSNKASYNDLYICARDLGGGCGENAVCTDTTDSATCSCISGFTGDGNTCVPTSDDNLITTVGILLGALVVVGIVAVRYTICKPKKVTRQAAQQPMPVATAEPIVIQERFALARTTSDLAF